MNRERLFSRLGQTPYKALIDATALGRSARHTFVDLDHWALCMLRRDDSDLSKILLELNSDRAVVQNRLEDALARMGHTGESLRDISPSLERCVAPALSWSQIAAPSRHIRSLHVVLTWLEDESTCRWLQRLDPKGLGALSVEAFLARFEARCVHWPEAREHAGTDSGVTDAMALEPAAPAAPDGTLARWATCLSEQAEKNELDPVVGRNDELRAVIDILLRRRQNNPILVGEAGVGKTSVVEALAQRIHRGEVPAGIQSAKVWALDIARLQAGASARGEFEQRLRSVIDAVIASEHPIILFCDEAHTLIGAGGAAGTGDAVNLIKPMLARGQLRMIAATTWSEYKQFIEPDAALTRRFQTVAVVEPDNTAAIAMLRVIAPRFSGHHGVQIADSALTAAVKLSRRYLPGRQLPDKAISLLDTACARVSMSQSTQPADLEALHHDILTVSQALQWRANDRRLGLLHDDDQHLHSEHQLLQEKAASLSQEVQTQRDQVGNWLKRLSDSEPNSEQTPALPQTLNALANRQKTYVRPWVDAQAIADILSEWTGVPGTELAQDDAQRMVEMEQLLQTRIHGQNGALQTIVQTLKVSRAGLNEPHRPLGVLMLVGPTGTGKSQTAAALAELLFSGERHLIHFNMNEFQESHTVSTLKGAPPGYVGFGKGGRLTEAVRQRPYSVLLLDEFDRAHSDVHEMFLQVFDQGWMEDGEGRRINFRNCLILLTSNLGDADIEAACAATPDITQPRLEAVARERLQTRFPPALMGRLQIVAFKPLDTAALTRIAEQALAEVGQRLAESTLDWQVDSGVAPWIAQAVANNPASGRAVRDMLRQHVLPVIAQNLLAARAEQRILTRVRLCADPGLSLYFDEMKETTCA